MGFFRDFLFYGISYKTMNAGNIRLAFQGRKEAVARQFVENFPSVVFIEIKQLWNPPQRNRVRNHHRREIQRFARVWRKSGKRRIQYCVHGFGSVTRQVAGLIRHLLKRFSMICNKAVVLLLIGYMFILVKIRSGKFHSQREPRQQLGDVSSGFRFIGICKRMEVAQQFDRLVLAQTFDRFRMNIREIVCILTRSNNYVEIVWKDGKIIL